MKKPVVLMILDGWGVAAKGHGNAISLAKTPNYDDILSRYPHSCLKASGEAVGLPKGQQGNSEVGHLNLGAGRIVYQELTRLNKAMQETGFQDNEVFQDVMAYSLREQKPLHLMGLVSPGGVHSHMDHLTALVKMAKLYGLTQVYIHCFLDGRDVPPSSAEGYLEQLEAQLLQIGVGEIATLSGRYYAMDRDNRWDRVEKAYRAMVDGIGEEAASAAETIGQAYQQGITDEFLVPTVIVNGHGKAKGRIGAEDGVIFFNFRADRARELTKSFVLPDFDAFARPIRQVKFVGMTQYEEGLPMLTAFPPEELANTLGEVISKAGLTQYRVAETEKYAHVTFFFNGGVEETYASEQRVLVASPQVATYDMQPAMSATEVTENLLHAIASGQYDFILVNYANTDMVGHTGNLYAAIQAVETVDDALGQIMQAVIGQEGVLLVMADHGNVECMIDEQHQQPFTAHTANEVPFLVISQETHTADDGILADVAPTVLRLLGVKQPKEMTGKNLIH